MSKGKTMTKTDANGSLIMSDMYSIFHKRGERQEPSLTHLNYK